MIGIWKSDLKLLSLHTKTKNKIMSKESNTGGIGFGAVLFLIFLTLKLTNHINWSWWWIFSPFWIPLLIAVGLGLVWLILWVKDKF